MQIGHEAQRTEWAVCDGQGGGFVILFLDVSASVSAHCSLLTAHCSLLTAHCSLLVINAGDKPLLCCQVAIDATEHFAFFRLWVDHCDVPFVPRPNIFAPPISGTAPRTGSTHNLSTNVCGTVVASRIDSRRLSFSCAHLRTPSRAKNSKAHHTMPIFDFRFSITDSAVACSFRISSSVPFVVHHESFHLKCIRPMCV